MCFGCSKEPSHRDGSFKYPQHMFRLRNKKNNFQLCTLIWRPASLFRKRVSTVRVPISYRQDCVKFKDFSRTSKRLSYMVFKDFNFMENTDFNVKILLQKC